MKRLKFWLYDSWNFIAMEKITLVNFYYDVRQDHVEIFGFYHDELFMGS